MASGAPVPERLAVAQRCLVPKGMEDEYWAQTRLRLRDMARHVLCHFSALAFERGAGFGSQFLAEQARIIGAPVETGRLAYRLDTRGPDEVRRARGFEPNEGKTPGGIYDHVRPTFPGTRSFVSLGLEADPSPILSLGSLPSNRVESPLSRRDQALVRGLLENGPDFIREHLDEGLVWWMHDVHKDGLRRLRRFLNQSRHDSVDDWLPAKPGQSNSNFPSAELYLTYQYKVPAATGIRVPATLGASMEREFVTTSVPLSSISHWRPVYLIARPSQGAWDHEDEVERRTFWAVTPKWQRL